MRFRETQPDLTFMDLQMPGMGGVAAIAAIRKDFPVARIVVLTTYKGDVQALRAPETGALGYVLKSELRKEVIDTVHQVMEGKRRIPDDVAADIAHHAGDEPLTGREMDVMIQLSLGATNRDIASIVGISDETVKVHTKRIFSKLDARDRTQAVAIALRRGIIAH